MRKKTIAKHRQHPGKGFSLSMSALLLILASSLWLFSGKSTEPCAEIKSKNIIPSKTKSMNKDKKMAAVASMAVPFVKNVGQFHREVKFAADLFTGRFFLTDQELVYSLIKHSGKKNARQDKHELHAEPEKNMPGRGLAFKEFFVDKKGNKINFKSTGDEQAATVVSYFKGNDPSQWREGMASYQGVSLGQIYPGIEVKLKASGKNVEKIFYVSPRTDVADIKIGVAGIAALEISNNERLLLKNRLGELAMRSPIAWQEIDGQRREVKVNYRLLGKKQYGFTISGEYDKNHALVIDPELDTLLASTFLGGSGYGCDTGTSLALDSSGNVYVTGVTFSADFPTTFGVYDQVYNGEPDIFVAKLNSELNMLLASTFLGGGSYDAGYSLTLDSAGNVFVTGTTRSFDFPSTSGAYDRTNCNDVFISKLSGNLSSLMASTFLGGSGSETGLSLALDHFGNVHVTGYTDSNDFPTTPGAFDPNYSGSFYDSNRSNTNVFVSKLNNELTTLLASTYLNGTGDNDNVSYSLALDNTGNVYVTGLTNSAGFPTTPGAYDRTYNGSVYYERAMDRDVFVSKLTSDLTTMLASTFLGGKSDETGYSLALDNAGNVFVTGDTDSFDFPTTQGAYDQTRSTYSGDVFIAKLDNNLTTLVASTYLGGEGYAGNHGKSLTLDNSGNIYVTGNTNSADFPTTPGAFDRSFNELDGTGTDAFVSKINNDLTELLYSTYLGGGLGVNQYNGSYDAGMSLVLDRSGNVYLTGITYSHDFPTTPMAYDQTYTAADSHEYGDAFIAKLGSGLKVILDLQAERREIRAFRILNHYGLIKITVDDSGIPIAEYRLYHRAGDGPYSLIRTILPHELQNNQFQIQDKYLEKGTTYTYIVEAYNAAGQLVGRSAEKTI